MSNRVSPAPINSSPLPPVDSPLPEDILAFSPSPPPPPPPPIDDDESNDKYDDDRSANAYTPLPPHTPEDTEDIEQAVYDPPPPEENSENDRQPLSPRTASTDVPSVAVTNEDKTSYYSSVRKSNKSSSHAEADLDLDLDDDTLPTHSSSITTTTDPKVKGECEDEDIIDVTDEKGEEGGGDEEGQQQVRHRKPLVGRLPPIGDGEYNADDSNYNANVSTHDDSPKGKQGSERQTRPGEEEEEGTGWGHHSYPHQQQQQQQQQQSYSDFNPLQQQQDHHKQQQQEQYYAMSARPNSGISRKDQEDENVIGANNAGSENGFCAILLTALSYILVILFLPMSLCVTFKVVQEYERAVIFRLGRLLPGGAKGPGIFFVMPCIEEYTKVDLRTVSFDVPPQEVLTRDSVTVSVDAVVYYRISNPTVSVANVENAANSTQLLAQTTLRNVLGTQNLAEILSNREHISEQMQIVLDGATDKWGIKVERVEIKDVRLPTQLQRAMATEAEAARDARAKVIAAEGEQKASVALREAAEIIADTPAAMQLRYLQTLNSISAEKNSTIIFPIPIELVGSMIKK